MHKNIVKYFLKICHTMRGVHHATLSVFFFFFGIAFKFNIATNTDRTVVIRRVRIILRTSYFILCLHSTG